MAISETVTKLPLTTFARLMQIHPLHFEQVVYPGGPQIGDQSFFQYAWQDSDLVGRDAIAKCIAKAEADIEAELGYRLLPSWEVDERDIIQGPLRPELVSFGGDVRGYHRATIMNWKHFVSGGIRATTQLGAGIAVAYTDPDGDSYKELATVVVPGVTVAKAEEVRLFYPGQSVVDSTYEIRPIHVAISGTTATITFRREQAVILTAQFGGGITASRAVVDATDDSKFLATVDVWRVWNDPSTMVSFLWNPTNGPCSSCFGIIDPSTPCPSCSYLTQTGCLLARDERLSIVEWTPGTWDASSSSYTPAAWTIGRDPDIGRFYYYAGLRNNSLATPSVTMDEDWAETVAIYAASMTARPLAASTPDYFDQWRTDLTYQSGSGENSASYRLTDSDAACPWGYRRGAVYAWRRCQRPNVSAGQKWVNVR